MTTVARLTIEMAADLARLQKDMSQAKGMVGGAMEGMSKAAHMAKTALVGMAVTFVTKELVGMVKSAIDAADKLDDLAKTTGVSASQLSALAAVGRTTGTTAEQIAERMTKLAKNMVDVQKPTSAAGQALKSLGISAEDFRKLKPDEQMLELAKAMDKFADGGGKAAAAEAILGKGAAQLIPYMKDLAGETQLVAEFTDEQAAAANNLKDQLTNLQTTGGGWARELAKGITPALSLATEAFVDVFKSSSGVSELLAQLVRDGAIQRWTEAGIRGISYLLDAFSYIRRAFQIVGEALLSGFYALSEAITGIGGAFKKLLEGDVRGAVDQVRNATASAANIMRDFGKEAAEVWSEDTFGRKLRDRMDDIKALGTTAEAAKPQLDYQEVAAKSEAALRKQLSAAKEATEQAQQSIQLTAQLGEAIGFTSEQILEGIELVQVATTGASEWALAAEDVFASLSDALFRAFEEGKGFMQAFRDTLKNTFNSLILRPTIEAIMNPIAGALSGPMQAAGQSIQGVISNSMSWLASGVGKMFGGSGSGLLSGVGRMGAGAPTGAGGMQGAMAALGPWAAMAAAIYMAGDAMYEQGWTGGGIPGMSLSNMLSMSTAGYGLGGLLAPPGGPQLTAWGHKTLAPFLGDKAAAILSGSVLSSALFGYKDPKIKDQGLDLSVGGGTISGSRYANLFYKGGVFRSDKKKTVTSDLGEDLDLALSMQASGIFESMKGYAQALGLPAAALENVTTELKVSAGKEGEDLQKAIDTFFEQYSEDLAKTYAEALEPLRHEGEALADTMRRLVGLSAFSDSLNSLGGVFTRVAQLSISAREELIGMAGGMEAFLAKANAFVRGYYSEAEQAGIAARTLVGAFAELGLDPTGLASRGDLRALIESRDLSTTAGREQLSALLDIAGAFAPIADFMAKNGGSLTDVAALAPQNALLESILSDSEASTLYAEQTVAGVAAVETAVTSVEAAVAASGDNIARGIDALRVALEEALQRNSREIVGAIEATA